MKRMMKRLKKRLKVKKDAFTLVELLIVIMIVAILAGMMMLSMSSATDLAEATKILNDLRTSKTAAVFLYADDGLSWNFAAAGPASGAVEASMDRYMDRPTFTGANAQYDLYFASAPVVAGETPRILIGIRAAGMTADTDFPARVREKLTSSAATAGLFWEDGTPYDNQNIVYMPLR